MLFTRKTKSQQTIFQFNTNIANIEKRDKDTSYYMEIQFILKIHSLTYISSV